MHLFFSPWLWRWLRLLVSKPGQPPTFFFFLRVLFIPSAHPPCTDTDISLSLSLCTQVSCVVFPFPSLSIFSPSHPASALLRRRSHTKYNFLFLFDLYLCACV
jgi:hypothetical protein